MLGVLGHTLLVCKTIPDPSWAGTGLVSYLGMDDYCLKV